MAVKSGFFRSVGGDRKYLAEFFTSYFASFIGNGVFINPSTSLQVIANQNFTTVVKPGKGWINGHYLENDADITINHQPPNGTLRRIDRIVFAVNFESRSMDIYLKEGVPATNAVAPNLIRSATLYELALADVIAVPGTTSISQSNIIDQRMNGNLCGIVHGTVEQLDTTTLFNQYQQFLVDKGVEFDQQLAVNQETFETWFASLVDILDGDVAANLTNMLLQHVNNATPQKHIEVVNSVPGNLINKGLLLVLDDVDNPNNPPEVPTSMVLSNRIDVVNQNLGNIDSEITEVKNDISTVQSNLMKKEQELDSFRGFVFSLENTNTSTALQVFGDSTGNDTNEWVYKLSEYLASKFPNFLVLYRIWSEDIQEYATPYQLTNPSSGYTRMGGGTQTRYLPSDEIEHIGGDIDIRVKLKMPNWNPSNIVTPIARYGSSPIERSWYLSILQDGRLNLNFTTNGSDYHSATSPNPITADANSVIWIRAQLDVDNELGGYSVTFYQSEDGWNWIGLDTYVNTVSGVVSLNDAKGVYEIGGRGQTGEILPIDAELYEVDVRKGFNGYGVVPRLPDLWWDRQNGQSHGIIGAPTLTIVNGSKAGANINSYLFERTEKMSPLYGQSVVMISDSHNEGVSVNGVFKNTYAKYIENIRKRFVSMPIIAIAQNPQSRTIDGHKEHDVRIGNLFEIASANNVDVLNVYGEFLPNPDIYLSDGVHPNEAGQTLWTNKVIRAIPE